MAAKGNCIRKQSTVQFAEINENAWSITWCDVLLDSKDALFLVVVVFAVYLAVFVKTSFACTFNLTYFNKLDYGS